MKTIAENWTGAYWVITSFESADGGSGWDNEYYGPFFTKNEAYSIAKKVAGSGKPKYNKTKYLVEIVRSLDDSVDKSCENSDLMPTLSSNYFENKYCGLRREYAEA